MNPMEDWVPGKYPDRREPPESAIVQALRDAAAQLDETRRDREEARRQRGELVAQIGSMAQKVEALEAKVGPLVDAMTKARGIWWFLGVMVGVLGGIAAVVAAAATAATWLKLHLLNGGMPIR